MSNIELKNVLLVFLSGVEAAECSEKISTLIKKEKKNGELIITW